ncbi:hypothetical protein MRB53_038913 [Persea americana]|nr:hypothetical protein MRB53_038913 [Persea americana]
MIALEIADDAGEIQLHQSLLIALIEERQPAQRSECQNSTPQPPTTKPPKAPDASFCLFHSTISTTLLPIARASSSIEAHVSTSPDSRHHGRSIETTTHVSESATIHAIRASTCLLDAQLLCVPFVAPREQSQFLNRPDIPESFQKLSSLLSHRSTHILRTVAVVDSASDGNAQKLQDAHIRLTCTIAGP